MASLTQGARVWVNSGSLWWTGRPGVLRFMGSQRVGDNWATELNWSTKTDISSYWFSCFSIDRKMQESGFIEIILFVTYHYHLGHCLRPVFCFPPLWISLWGLCSGWRLAGLSILCLLKWQVTFFVDSLNWLVEFIFQAFVGVPTADM